MLNKILSFNYRPTLIASAIALALPSSAYSSIVRNDIDYQYFRDFAENKGKFSVGAKNIPIYNKQGTQIGTMLPELPMPDLRVATKTSGVAITIDPQYVTSVAHNHGYGNVSFGNEGTNADEHTFSYQIVARNLHGEFDYHIPRLHKLITEIAPIAVSSVPYTGKNPQNNAYLDNKRFPYFVRVGSGTQGSRDSKGEFTHISGAYSYLIGGTPIPVTQSKDGTLQAKGNVFSDTYGPMATYGMPGDSGSSLFAYDMKEKRWVAVGVLSTYTGQNGSVNTYILSRPDFITKIKQDDEVQIHNDGKNLSWQANGNQSTIIQNNGKTTNVELYDESLTNQDTSRVRPSLEAGKNIHFYGKDFNLTLNNSINQGAGALYFHTNATVSGDKPELTWLGGGINVDKDKTVTWSLHNPRNDRLSKIGEGTLYINGKGENFGDISVGDGTLILAQQALNGKTQAFNQIGITSGRATVVLTDENQVKPDNIYFGFRGGRLDTNGNNLRFSYIQNTDDGAQIVNHNNKRTSNITIDGIKEYKSNNIEWVEWSNKPKTDLGLYEYINQYHNNRTDYFVLKSDGNPYSYFPSNATSSANWEYLGNDKQIAIDTVLGRKNSSLKSYTFSGHFGENVSDKVNGALNVKYSPSHSDHMLMLNGGSNINGSLSVEKGKLLLSGKPVSHARDMITNQDIVKDDEWINRQFKANHFVAAKNGVFIVGRNVDRLEGDFTANDYARFHIGFLQRRTPSCVRSDYTGDTTCDTQATLSDNNFANLPTTQVFGNFRLNGHSSLTVGKSHLHSKILGTQDSGVNLARESQWTMTGDSVVGRLHMENSLLTLNDQFDKVTNTRTPWKNFNKLEISQNLSGVGTIRYLTNMAQSQGDSVVVNGKATGSFTLALKNTGEEPSNITPLSLLKINGSQQNSEQLNIMLENGYADLGAYRYILKNQDNDYRLFNPLKMAEESSTEQLAQLTELQRKFEALRKNIQNQQDTITNLDTSYRHSLNQKQTLDRKLKTATKEMQNLRSQLYSSGRSYSRRFSFYYQNALQRLKVAQNNVTSLKKSEKIQSDKVKTALDVLNAAKAELKATETSQSSINQQILKQQELNRLKSLEKANALCLQEKLSAKICNKVVLNASNEDLSVSESAFAEKVLNVEEAEIVFNQTKISYQNALEQLNQAKLQGDQTIIEQAQANLAIAETAQSKALAKLIQSQEEEANALLVLEQDNNEIIDALNRVDTSSNRLVQAELISRYANTALSDLSATVNATLQISKNLDRYLLDNSASGVWLNQQWQKNTHHSDSYRPYKQQLNLTQIGVNQDISPSLSVGAVISHSESRNNFSEGALGKNRLTSLSIYVKRHWKNDLFSSLYGSFGNSRNHIEYDTQLVKFQRSFADVGLNLGKKWQIADWQIQPSAGIHYYHFTAAKYQLEKANVESPSLNLLAYNIGLKLDKTFELNQLRVIPSFSTYYYDATQQSMNVQSELNVNNIGLSQQFGRYFNNELGLAIQANSWQIDLNAGTITGNDIDRQKYAGLKIKYNWK